MKIANHCIKVFLVVFGLLFYDTLLAQNTHSIKGQIIDKGSRESIPYVSIKIKGSNTGFQADSIGHFSIDQLRPGSYILELYCVGYTPIQTAEYLLAARDIFITLEMEENASQLKEISVIGTTFRRIPESPVSLHIVGVQEIEKSPGANRDISRIVQSYPGVAFSPVSYRNDLIVRGGGPSENRFYLDGIEIPNINHFSTQGASGGPVGIINADLIREVNFYTGAFPSSRGNALSSVLDFKLRDGDLQKKSVKATLGASEISLTSNGYLSNKTTYLASVRYSYLQFLFDMLGLPFLPTYTDAQFKIKTKLKKNNELIFMGLTGIDNMKLNKKASSEDAEYVLNYLPKIAQETFTIGSVYKHYGKTNTQTFVLSHSYLNNKFTKYLNNENDNPEMLTFKYKSLEQETKFRFENYTSLDKIKINSGINADYANYTNSSFQKLFYDRPVILDYNTDLSFLRYGLFGTITYTTANERLTGTLGIRTDAADFSKFLNNPLKQLSPRLSLSYLLLHSLDWNLSLGRYYQLPPFTALGFKDNEGNYLNKGLKYMKSNQISSGLTYRIGKQIEISAEGFYKGYENSPLSIKDSIPLMSKGNDYGVIGNELLTSDAQGKSYGLELLFRWIVPRKVNILASSTFYRSKFRNNSDEEYIASNWDNRFIFNLSGTYYFPKNWSFGAKVRSIGGAPYTPYDLDKSSLVSAWDVQSKPFFDFSRFNELRGKRYTQFDIRVDKTFYINKYMFGLYIDIQNITGSSYKEQDKYVSTGEIINPTAPESEQRYKMKYLKSNSGSVIPTIGATFEF